MAHQILLVRRQLRHGLRKRRIVEDGVVAEAARSSGLESDSPFAGGFVLEDDLPLVGERYGAYVAGGSIRLRDVVEKLEKPRVLPGAESKSPRTALTGPGHPPISTSRPASSATRYPNAGDSTRPSAGRSRKRAAISSGFDGGSRKERIAPKTGERVRCSRLSRLEVARRLHGFISGRSAPLAGWR
jgi:hypothetical protein